MLDVFLASYLTDRRDLLFQTRPPRVGIVAFMTDANDTSSAAEAWMGEVQFAPRALDGRKSPTSMLR